MSISIFDRMVGWAGAALIVLAYLLLTLELLNPTSAPYNLMNLCGGLFLAYRVFLDRNWSNLALNLFFAAVGVLALVKFLFT